MYEEKTEEWYIINILDTQNEFENITERFTEASNPVLDFNGEDNPFGVMMSSEFSFNMLNETAEDGMYLDLFTGQENRFLVEIRKRIDTYREDSPDPSRREYLFWTGFLLPDVYSEPYKNGVFFVNFTANDGLSTLKTKSFDFPYKSSVIQYISYCLRKTGLALNLYVSADIQNVAYNSWNNIFLPIENFAKKDDRQNCYEVLENLLKAMGCVLHQYDGSWYVTGYASRFQPAVSYQMYTPFGEFSGNRLKVRTKHRADFDEGSLSVAMSSPFKKVNLNVDFETDIDNIFPEKVWVNKELTEIDVQDSTDVYPLKAWSANNQAVLKAKGIGLGMLSVGGGEDASLEMSHVYLPQNAYPYYNYKDGIAPAFYTPTNLTWNYQADYIELKSSEGFFVSPKKESEPFKIDLDIEVDYMNYPNEGAYNDGEYMAACRVDFMVSNDVFFSTRKEHEKYQNVVEYKFEERQAGFDVLIYYYPDYLNWDVRMPQTYSQPKVNALINYEGLEIIDYGRLTMRIYMPITQDGQNQDHTLVWAQIKKLEAKVNGWEDEEYTLERLINYSTSFDRDLEFYDGKNDLYQNLFDIGHVWAINPNANYSLFQGFVNEYEDEQFYYWQTEFIETNVTYWQELFESKYSKAIIKKNDTWIRLSYMLGRLGSKDVFFEANEVGIVSLKISKSLVLSMTALEREMFFDNDGIFIPTFVSGIAYFPPHYNNYILWENKVTGNQGRYLDIYAQLIHEVQPAPVSRLEGTYRKNITPHDLVVFNWLGEKTYSPTRLTLNLSENKTDLLLVESKYQELNDYVNTD